MEKTKTCAFQANYHLIWAVKYRRKVLFGPVEVRLLEVLKTIAGGHGYRLLTCRVHGLGRVGREGASKNLAYNLRRYMFLVG